MCACIAQTQGLVAQRVRTVELLLPKPLRAHYASLILTVQTALHANPVLQIRLRKRGLRNVKSAQAGDTAKPVKLPATAVFAMSAKLGHTVQTVRSHATFILKSVVNNVVKRFF